MASKGFATIILLITLNLLFLSMTEAGRYQNLKQQQQQQQQPKCQPNALVLDACVDVLGLINVEIGNPNHPCCSAIQGLVDLELDVCLCTVVNANVLGIKLNLPIQLTALLNYCGVKKPHC